MSLTILRLKPCVKKWLRVQRFVPANLKTQEMCINAIGKTPWMLRCVLNCLKAQEMCNETMRIEPYLLEYVPDWFVTQQQLKLWHDYGEYEDNLFKKQRYNNYKKWKPQKASIKGQSMSIVWHSSRSGIVVFLKTKKERRKKLFSPLDMLRLKMY